MMSTLVQIGAGGRPFDGFVNIDPRPGAGLTHGHAHQLPFADNTVDVIFCNAVFEHLYLCHQVMAAREWNRVLTDDGVAILLGIPDFETIARLYLDRSQGVKRPVFDALEVYRYTHGFPEASEPLANWAEWSPADNPDTAPEGWLPQLHKSILDARALREVFAVAGLPVTVWRYSYPGDDHKLNLAAIASHGPVSADMLNVFPFAEFIDIDSMEPA